MSANRSHQPQDAATVAAVRDILGTRSLSTVRNLLSLNKLSLSVIQEIQNERISYSNACILAANLDHPNYEDILQKTILEKPKRDELKRMFKASDQTDEKLQSERYESLRSKLEVLDKIRRSFISNGSVLKVREVELF